MDIRRTYPAETPKSECSFLSYAVKVNRLKHPVKLRQVALSGSAGFRCE